MPMLSRGRTRTETEEMKTFAEKFRKFAYTDFYFIAYAAIVFIAWTAESAEFGFVAIIALTCLSLVILDDVLPITAPLFYAMCMIFTDQVEDFIFMWPTFIPLGIAIAFFLIRNRTRLRRPGSMTVPQLVLSVVLMIGGLGVCTAAEYTRALPNAIMLGFGGLAIYLLVYCYAGRDERRDVGIYFSKMLMWFGFVVLAEIAVWYIRADLPPSQWGSVARDFGWGIENNASTILSISAPMCFYLAVRYRWGGIYALCGLAQYIGIILTYSRGGILMAAVTGPVCAVVALVKAVDKKRMGMAYAVIIAAGVVAIGVLFDDIAAAIKSLFDQGFGPSSRDLLYAEAWKLFCSHPFLGVGLGYNGDHFAINTMQFYWFHSTLFQVLANMGVVGVLAYAFYYIARFRTLRKLRNPFNVFMLIAWLGFEGYSMMDTGTFVPFPTMALVLVTAGIAELISSRPQFRGEVDAYNRTFSRAGVAAEARRYDAFTPAYVREAA